MKKLVDTLAAKVDTGTESLIVELLELFDGLIKVFVSLHNVGRRDLALGDDSICPNNFAVILPINVGEDAVKEPGAEAKKIGKTFLSLVSA